MAEEQRDEEGEQVLAKSIRTGQVVYLAIGAAIIAYVVVGYLIASANDPFKGFVKLPPQVCTILRCVLWAMAVVGVLPLAMLLRRVVCRPETIRSTVRTVADFGALFLRQSILTAAVSEMPAIWGLILFLLAGSWVDLVGLCCLGSAYLAIMFPTASKAAALAEHMARGSKE